MGIRWMHYIGHHWLALLSFNVNFKAGLEADLEEWSEREGLHPVFFSRRFSIKGKMPDYSSDCF